MRRHRRQQGTTPRAGDLVIDARVGARLLGLHLLDIEARIVVAPVRPTSTLAVTAAQTRAVSGGDATSGDRVGQRRLRVPPEETAPPELAHAVHLIAEGADLLDQATRAR